MNKSNVLRFALAASAFLFAMNVVADDVVSNELKIDSAKFICANDLAESKMKVEFPVDVTTPLAKAVMKNIAETLGYEDTATLPQPSKMVDDGGIKRFYELCNDARETKSEGMTIGFPYASETKIEKDYESNKVVTFTTWTYSYEGGAHGNTSFAPTTFVKATGKKLDFSIFKNAECSELKAIIVAGLKQYFEVNTDKELKEMLFDVSNLNDIPLPQTPPYFTKDGIVLVYAQYEIAPYAAGMPEITIPYAKAKPLLTVEAAALME